MASVVARQRQLRPRVFAQGDTESVLRRLRAIRPDAAGTVRPTLAGLLTLGRYPQEFLPRLTVTFAAYPGVTSTYDIIVDTAVTVRTPIGDLTQIKDCGSA
jgi:ATP-dependent DNA helicase RecG